MSSELIELIAKLRKHGCHAIPISGIYDACSRAADTLSAQQGRIEGVSGGLERLSTRLNGLVLRDGGPAKVKLPSGAYLEGEGAAAYIEMVDAVTACFDRARAVLSPPADEKEKA